MNKEWLEDALARNPILGVPHRVIGYAQGRASGNVAAKMTDLRREERMRLLNPKALTQGGVSGGG